MASIFHTRSKQFNNITLLQHNTVDIMINIELTSKFTTTTIIAITTTIIVITTTIAITYSMLEIELPIIAAAFFHFSP